MRKLFNYDGLTLIEIIVTIALLGIIIIPFMGFFITSQKVNNESEREYKSIQLAQQYIEEIKAADIIDLAIYKDDDGDGTYVRNLPEDGNGYKVDIEIKPATNYVSPADTVVYDAVLKIGGTGGSNANYIYWNDIYSTTMNANKFNITIENSKIIIGTNSINTNATKIKVIFNTNAILNIVDSSKVVEMHIENRNNKDWEVNINNGLVPTIFELKEETASNILYDIIVNVTKNGYTATVNGTKVFK